MDFTWPAMLWATALVPLLWLGHRALVRRQQQVAEQFADARLLEHLLVRPPSWQRSVPFMCYLAGVLALALAMARPVASIPMLVNRAVVIMAIDTSRSMIGTDVAPNRLEVARRATRDVVNLLPRSTKVGLVEFSEYGTVLVAPTTDRAAFLGALGRLQLRSATAVGAGILAAVRIAPGRAQFLGERLDRLAGRPQAPPPQVPSEPPPSPDDLPPATIVLLSDGVSNFGPDPYEAAALAREGRVRIFTIGVGTPPGAVMTVDGQLVWVPFDAAGLERIAQITDGRYFSSAGEDELDTLYRQLGRLTAWERTRTEVSAPLVAMAGVLLLAGGGLSLWWFGRVP